MRWSSRRGHAAQQDQGALSPRCRCGKGWTVTSVVETTPGRMMLSEILPRTRTRCRSSLINRLLTKKEITEVIDVVYRHCGQKETVIFADRIMALGLQPCLQGRHFVRQGRPGRPRIQDELVEAGPD